MTRYVRMRLSNGEVRHLNTFKWDAEGALSKFLNGENPFDEPRLSTVENTDLARSALVEIYIVELEKEPTHPDPAFRDWGER